MMPLKRAAEGRVLRQAYGDNALEWQELPGKKESRVALRLGGVEPLNRAQWPEYHRWLRKKLELLHRIFAQRVKSLPARGVGSDGEGEEA